ncbi:MAG TPA: serine protease [Stellaceae bacterium]|nr:serine protease [Stellaceae bacterium]
MTKVKLGRTYPRQRGPLWWNAAALFAAGFAVAGCSPRLGPPAGSAAATPAVVADASLARDDYVARTLAERPPAGVGSRHLVADGTGFYVTGDEVLTNFHVAGKCGAITVGNGTEGEEVVATVVAGDPAADLALLRTERGVAAPARFAASAQAAPSAVVGYPERGLPVRIAELSPISALPGAAGTTALHYSFDGEVRRGNSGSPVLDASGAVLGVVVMKVDTVAVYQKTGAVVDNVGIAISNRAVGDFLRTNRVDVAAATPASPLPPASILDKAHGFVRQIGCWN